MPSILFVCTANQIRSPFAKAAFEKILAKKGYQMEKWKVGSAGTWIVPNLPIDKNLISVAAEFQLELTGHRPKQINSQLLEEYALIIVMEKGQKEAICYEFPSEKYKIFLLSAFNSPAYDIPDPHGMPIAQYRKVLSNLYDLINSSFNSICITARKLSLDTILN